MAEVSFYHSPHCPYARRVELLLEHLGIEYETVLIDLEEVPQDFRSVSPYGLVPAITHDGANLHESNIINEYLDEVYQGGLMPETALGKARARILMAYADDYWIPSVVDLKRALDEGATKTEIRVLQQVVLKRLREIETKFREGGPYLLGGALSLADLSFVGTITELPHYGMHIPDGLMRTKHWATTLAELPAVQEQMAKVAAEIGKGAGSSDPPAVP